MACPNAESEPAPPWVKSEAVEFDLSLPPEARYVEAPAAIVERGRTLLGAVVREIPSSGRWLADLVRLRTGNRFHREATALAQMIGGRWRDVLLANVSYDLTLVRLGCSTVALPTASGPVLARNMDWWPEDILAQTSSLLRFVRDGQLAYVNAGWPGAIGVVTGLSGRGFALALNAPRCTEGLHKLGYPVLLWLRRILEEASGFRDALARLSKQRVAAPALVTLVGSRNDERVVVERTARRCAHRWAEGDAPLVTTNDFRALPASDAGGEISLYATSCRRYDALTRFTREHHHPKREADPEMLLYALADPSVIQDITAQHILLHPRLGHAEMFVPRRLLR